MKNTVALIFSLIISSALYSQENLVFNEKGKFKIVQFTDLHWDNASEKCKETLATMRTVLEEEQPDFVVFTGDIVTASSAAEGWLAVIEAVVESEIPWSVTFGNHDEELNMKKEDIYKLLSVQPFFLGQAGSVSGIGNYALPIYKSQQDKKIATVVYLFDSHDYTHNPRLGKYDWIKFDQIEWYRKQSDLFTSLNSGTPIPSLAFFHIPLLEYYNVADSKDLLGDKYEGIASPEVNSGLFAAMVEQKDIMGVFVGHDHDNNYIGITKDIALGFGQVTGADAYGKLERGARVIELEEGKFAFKSWIRTPSEKKHIFYYPSGLTEADENTTFLPAQRLDLTKNGVRYEYYEGKTKTVDAITKLSLKEEGTLPNISIDKAKVEDYFAFRFRTWIKIPQRGFYKFYTYSDDGSKLFIDGKEVVNNDGGHSAKREEGIVALEAGFHKLEVRYFESYMGQTLDVGFSSTQIPETKLPARLLFVD